MAKIPNGAQPIESLRDLIEMWTNVDKKLVRITSGDEPPYTFRNKLYLPASMFSFFSGAVGSDGTKNAAGDTTGRQLVTEASGTTISGHVGNTAANTCMSAPPMFSPLGLTGSGTATAAQRRIFSVALTSDGAGAIAATEIVPALASYTAHCQVVGIWASATDAATTWTFAVTAGTILGPATHALAHTANAVTQLGATAAGQTGCPIYLRGTVAADDNKNLTVSAAGYAATQTAVIFGYYWYET